MKEKIKKDGQKTLREFKEFIFRGNVFDLAVGVIVGGAFGKITTSLVNDIIMPLVGVLLAGVDLKQLKLVIREAVLSAEGVVEVAEVAVTYGNFLQTILDFLIIAASVFVFVKISKHIREKAEKRKAEEAAAKAAAEAAAKAKEPPAPPKPTELDMLTEIRDLLKEKK